ncbi:flagellar biosynthetic protein FliR, partial [Klebsiella pneumoniae]|uniref:flagellar biosynthetic protein FliR n=1 Tax=Klebsiella pneumoniae TaxID=573 RepID=UPI00190F5707
ASVVLDFIANYFWPYTRIAAMLMVMTVTGARFVPARVRLYLGLALTFAVMPAIPAVPSDIALLSLQGFMITFEQIVIGVALGMVTQFLVQIFV